MKGSRAPRLLRELGGSLVLVPSTRYLVDDVRGVAERGDIGESFSAASLRPRIRAWYSASCGLPRGPTFSATVANIASQSSCARCVRSRPSLGARPRFRDPRRQTAPRRKSARPAARRPRWRLRPCRCAVRRHAPVHTQLLRWSPSTLELTHEARILMALDPPNLCAGQVSPPLRYCCSILASLEGRIGPPLCHVERRFRPPAGSLCVLEGVGSSSVRVATPTRSVACDDNGGPALGISSGTADPGQSVEPTQLGRLRSARTSGEMRVTETVLRLHARAQVARGIDRLRRRRISVRPWPELSQQLEGLPIVDAEAVHQYPFGALSEYATAKLRLRGGGTRRSAARHVGQPWSSSGSPTVTPAKSARLDRLLDRSAEVTRGRESAPGVGLSSAGGPRWSCRSAALRERCPPRWR